MLGTATRDPEFKRTADGQMFCILGIVTRRKWKSQNGERKEAEEFTNLIFWSKFAEIISKSVRRGDRIYVEGTLQTRKWTDDNQNVRYSTEVAVKEFVLLGPETSVIDEDYDEDDYETEI